MGVISECHSEPVRPQTLVEKSLRVSGVGAVSQRSDAPIRPSCASRQKRRRQHDLSGTRRWQLNVIKHYFGAAISSYDNYLHRLYPFI
jgi:hypothetical protein